MKIATWNVNSIRARMERLRPWIEANAPDVLLLQETKITDDLFPRDELAALGYHAACTGQRTYNGVAILSRLPLEGCCPGFRDGGDDGEARLIEGTVQATFGRVRLICAYVPNGKVVGSESWDKKLAWLSRLRRFLDERCSRDELLLLGGDMNVAPEPRDVHDPGAWEGSVLYHPHARAALAAVTEWGLVDAFRARHPEPGFYSWWDYRMLAFPKGMGLRIDHVFVTPCLAEHLEDTVIDRDARKGKQPSDHAPVIATFR